MFMEFACMGYGALGHPERASVFWGAAQISSNRFTRSTTWLGSEATPTAEPAGSWAPCPRSDNLVFGRGHSVVAALQPLAPKSSFHLSHGSGT